MATRQTPWAKVVGRVCALDDTHTQEHDEVMDDLELKLSDAYDHGDKNAQAAILDTVTLVYGVRAAAAETAAWS